GEDAVYIFLDTISGQGYLVKEEFYADKMVEIKGQDGEITSSKYYTFKGLTPFNWSWKPAGKAVAASARKEIEASVELSGEFRAYFHVVSWDGEDEDYSEDAINFHEIIHDGGRYVGQGASGATLGYWRFNNEWGYRKPITIDYTKVEADLTDFPVMISTTDTDLRDHARSDGDDIFFTKTDGTKLSHEIESYDSSSGELVAWVKIPSLSGSANTELYMYYGNSECSGQEDAENVWDSNYKMVQHLEETSKGTGSYDDHFDSTSNNNDGEAENGLDMDATGKIDGADDFDGTNDYVTVAHDASLNLVGPYTLEAWVKPAANINTQQYILIKYNAYTLEFRRENGDPPEKKWLHNYFWDGVRYQDVTTTTYTWAGGTWYYVAFTHDGSTVKAYVDGSEETSVTKPTISSTSTSIMRIGCRAGPEKFLNGILDEVRISNTARSDDWIKTSYNNQNNPITFMSFGDEQQQPLTNWQYRKKITIDNTKVQGSSDLSNFPVLI
ncbi:MAG: DUF2341 domain-containing protein, partial [Thermoplasmata archaeon]|nr:DUF2341 domain-containing protein [Thermoplasmata archaeon]